MTTELAAALTHLSSARAELRRAGKKLLVALVEEAIAECELEAKWDAGTDDQLTHISGMKVEEA